MLEFVVTLMLILLGAVIGLVIFRFVNRGSVR